MYEEGRRSGFRHQRAGVAKCHCGQGADQGPRPGSPGLSRVPGSWVPSSWGPFIRPIWFHMHQYGSWVHMDPFGLIWVHLGPIWARMGPIWVHMDSFGLIWVDIDPYGPIWAHMGPYGSHVLALYSCRQSRSYLHLTRGAASPLCIPKRSIMQNAAGARGPQRFQPQQIYMASSGILFFCCFISVLLVA